MAAWTLPTEVAFGSRKVSACCIVAVPCGWRGCWQALEAINPSDRLLFAMADAPTKRNGPHVEGAGVHRNSTPGPAEHYVYGHAWVTLVLMVRHAGGGARRVAGGLAEKHGEKRCAS